MRGVPVFAALVLLPGLALAQAEVSRAHMEACLRWTLAGGRFMTRNSCDTPVAIQFMTLYDGHITEKNVPPGGVFQSDPVDTERTDQMMFSACPVGYRPSPSFTLGNAQAIRVSLYNCQPPNKPTS